MPPKAKAAKPAPAAPKPTQAVRSGREMAADFEQDGLKALERRNWEKAADGYLQAMELWEKYKEPLCLSRCAARLGEIAYEQDDFAEALAQFSRQADFARKHKARDEAAHPIAVALHNVGVDSWPGDVDEGDESGDEGGEAYDDQHDEGGKEGREDVGGEEGGDGGQLRGEQSAQTTGGAGTSQDINPFAAFAFGARDS